MKKIGVRRLTITLDIDSWRKLRKMREVYGTGFAEQIRRAIKNWEISR